MKRAQMDVEMNARTTNGRPHAGGFRGEAGGEAGGGADDGYLHADIFQCLDEMRGIMRGCAHNATCPGARALEDAYYDFFRRYPSQLESWLGSLHRQLRFCDGECPLAQRVSHLGMHVLLNLPHLSGSRRPADPARGARAAEVS